MAAPVARQKINLPAAHLAANERVRRRTKRSTDFAFRRITQLFHLIQTATANDADGWGIVVFHSRNLSGLNPKDRQDERWIISAVHPRADSKFDLDRPEGSKRSLSSGLDCWRPLVCRWGRRPPLFHCRSKQSRFAVGSCSLGRWSRRARWPQSIVAQTRLHYDAALATY